MVEGHTLTSSYSLVKEMSPCTIGEAQSQGQGWLCPSPAPVDLVAPPEVREPNTGPRSLDSSCQGLPTPAQRTQSPQTQGMQIGRPLCKSACRLLVECGVTISPSNSAPGHMPKLKTSLLTNPCTPGSLQPVTLTKGGNSLNAHQWINR